MGKAILFIVNICMWNLVGCSTVIGISLYNIISPIVRKHVIQFAENQVETSKDVYKSLETYRQIHILNTFNNQLQKKTFGCLMVYSIFGISIGLALLVTCLRGNQQKGVILAIVTYTLAISNGSFIIIFVLSDMVTVRLKSERYLMKVRTSRLNYICRTKIRWIRRFWSSGVKIKIEFGANNFLENLTPLKCFDFAANFQFFVVRSKMTLQILLSDINKTVNEMDICWKHVNFRKY